MIFYEDSHSIILYERKREEKQINLLQADSGQRIIPSFAKVAQKIDRPKISQFLGMIIFVVSLAGLFLFAGPVVFSEISYRLNQGKKEITRVINNEPVKEKKISFSDLLGEVNFEKIPDPVDTNFGIVIPKIGVNAKVVPNVDPNTAKIFGEALKRGVAHAAGTALPNEEGLTYIFGHSTDYSWNVTRFNAIFYQIKDLEIGDEINLFYNGQRYFYKVTEKRTVGSQETSFLKEQTIGRLLVLQTCWPPGTTKERLLVFARPINMPEAGIMK
ncbi:MAG: Sortase family protein [Microgenomates group bacterium ADurb.Bin219]|nr:MAG: Sortase family protein [Microgenomates group bacterium ADurb.Bin219]HNP89373.1 sortase [Candidatus Woesebacteria bacterium]